MYLIGVPHSKDILVPSVESGKGNQNPKKQWMYNNWLQVPNFWFIVWFIVLSYHFILIYIIIIIQQYIPSQLCNKMSAEIGMIFRQSLYSFQIFRGAQIQILFKTYIFTNPETENLARWSTLTNHFHSKSPIVAQWYKFGCCHQGDSESLADFIANLWRPSANCNFKADALEQVTNRNKRPLVSLSGRDCYQFKGSKVECSIEEVNNCITWDPWGSSCQWSFK